jgi:hypothetical protein
MTHQVTYLEFIAPADGFPHQADAIYFDLSSVFALVPHTLFRHKLSFGLSDGYVNWFPNYLTNR